MFEFASPCKGDDLIRFDEEFLGKGVGPPGREEVNQMPVSSERDNSSVTKDENKMLVSVSLEEWKVIAKLFWESVRRAKSVK